MEFYLIVYCASQILQGNVHPRAYGFSIQIPLAHNSETRRLKSLSGFDFQKLDSLQKSTSYT